MAVAGAFTVHELAAAKRLILLSGSNTSSSGSACSAIFAASLGSSINAPPVMAQAVVPYPVSEDYLSDEEREYDEQEVHGIQRRTRLYRLGIRSEMLKIDRSGSE
ncbi:hypothetical protein E2562_004722 [Oryza meyeriana var. granulata]|uniref:Uncharacterized protein n=1 Tax=Oryza meyeriana var. granulata TaxID=110450 RepID=A0A6G1DE70_9ORYZ|nr:hypothetical protein E2562_004722 [Oryza meyeriana var. granulata]